MFQDGCFIVGNGNVELLVIVLIVIYVGVECFGDGLWQCGVIKGNCCFENEQIQGCGCKYVCFLFFCFVVLQI